MPLLRDLNSFMLGAQFFIHLATELYVLQRIGFHPTVMATENMLLKRFELSSPQAKSADCYILYPFSYRATQSVININK